MNWKQILTDLKNAGFSQEQIAQACGCSQATISELVTGKAKNPGYPVGAALVAFYKKRVRKSAAQSTHAATA